MTRPFLRQATQKEVMHYIQNHDWLDVPLSREERKEIAELHRQLKTFLADKNLVNEKVKQFRECLMTCSPWCVSYYEEVLTFLETELNRIDGPADFHIIRGFETWSLNCVTLLDFMKALWDIKETVVNI